VKTRVVGEQGDLETNKHKSTLRVMELIFGNV
jgi:hypothetical protein